MVVAPFAGRFLDRAGWEAASRAVNLPAFVWMAWIFWFLIIGLAIDGWNVLLATLGRWQPALRAARCTPCLQAGAALTLILAATLWGAVEASRPLVREHRVRVPRWPADTPPLRLVQVSDVHVSAFHDSGWNQRIVAQVAALKPDVLISTGDLTDAPYMEIAGQASGWASVQTALGKFAVLGNHDYYAGVDGALRFHEEAGFQVLRGHGLDVGPKLRILGLDDPAGQHLGQSCFYKPELLAGFWPAPERFTILLRHQPIPTRLRDGVVNLQLSGHTHAGQIFPFRGIVRMLYTHTAGWYPMGNARLYVHAGTGTWGPPLRVFAPPEIALFILEPAAPSAQSDGVRAPTSEP